MSSNYRPEAAALATIARQLHDPNPIHLDVDHAQASGLGDRVIVQGPASASWALDALAARTGDHDQIEEFTIRFLSPVLAGDEIRPAVAEDGEGVSVEMCRGSITVARATAVLRPPSR